MLNDLTIGQITDAANELAAIKFEPQLHECVKEAFKDGACWAFQHLLDRGGETAWCNNNIKDN